MPRPAGCSPISTRPRRRRRPSSPRRAGSLAPRIWRSTPATRDSLEICRTQTGSVAGSLLGCIDRCVTAPGRRLLAADLSAPLTDRHAIEARLALVQWLHEEPLRRERVRDALKAMPDIGRALGRLVAGRGSPRDLALLRDGLIASASLKQELEAEPDRPDLLASLLPELGGHAALTDKLGIALVPAPPLDASKGGYIAEGYDAALDALRVRKPRRPPRDRRAGSSAIATQPASRRSRSATTRCSAIISRSAPSMPTG